jgi:hypothetical protein
MSVHPHDTELALFAAGDFAGWAKLRLAWHVRGCPDCRTRVAAFRLDQEQLREELGADELPAGVSWERMAQEMTANIHVGLAAGECVTPHPVRKPNLVEGLVEGWNWRPAAAVAALCVVLVSAWWLNLSGDLPVLRQAINRVWSGQAGVPVNDGPMVTASAAGSEFSEDGGTLRVSTGDQAPVSVQVSFDGSASSRYVDDATGQVTIATVYVQ